MSSLTVAGLTVLEGSITFPLEGAWTANLVLEAAAMPSGRVALEGPGLALSGSIVGGGTAFARTGVSIVGGAGRLWSTIGPRWWRNAPLRLPLSDALSAGGEALSATSDAAALTTTLRAWTRAEDKLARELTALASAAGAIWRVLDDGSIWVGSDTWQALDLDHRVTDVDPAAGWRELALEAYAVRPGIVLADEKVGRVTYRISGERVRCEVHALQ